MSDKDKPDMPEMEAPEEAGTIWRAHRRLVEDHEAIANILAEEKKKTETIVQADRLKRARAAAGYKSATEAAQKLGLVESTYLAHENGSRGASYAQMGVYARAFGVNALWLIFGDSESIAERQLHADLLRVRGFIQDGHWLEGDAFLPSTPETRKMRIPVVPDKEYFKAAQYAIRMDRRFGPFAKAGEYLIVADWEGLEQERAAGLTGDNIYLVRRSRGDMHAFAAWRSERIREIASASEPVPEHPYTWTITKETSEPYRPIAGERIKIIGLVIGKYAPRSALRASSEE